METKDELKALIRVKFGNVRRFCEISGENYHALRNMLNKPNLTKWQKAKIESVYATIRKSTNKLLSEEISLRDRQFIEEAIKKISGNVTAFCRDYKQFPRSTVNDVIRGRMKTKTENYFALFNFINNYLND